MKEQSGRKAGMLMDKTVFGYFKHFVSDDDEARVKGACGLIEFLCNGQKIKPHNGSDDAEEESVVPVGYVPVAACDFSCEIQTN